MRSILNFFEIHQNLATSGQPSENEFKKLAAEGFQNIINLAMPDSDNALVNQGAILQDLKLSYIHIPVVWSAPTQQNVVDFFAAMQQPLQKTLVHCAYNYRASAFLYLYQKYILNLDEEQARYPMREIWQPNEIWSKFLNGFNYK